MKLRTFANVLVLVVTTGTIAFAQQPTGEIFGRVTDGSNAVLPGVTVTLTGPELLTPRTAITSETGSYQFPRLDVGTYSVAFELANFKTVVHRDVRITAGFSGQVNAQLAVSTVEETVTVTGSTPVIDRKATGTKETFTNELLQGIPSARDPWVILQQTAGIAMDRENVGGNMSGQQSNYVSRGAMPANNKWMLDGIDITDLSATGASPTYYDFDMLDEVTVNTGGVDVTQQTGGVGINLVTKAGSDRFRGSSRFFDTNHRTESNNISDVLRRQGATSGNPIQDIQDYGVEAGGPIQRGRAWIWGAVGKQRVDVGVIGFYEPTATCQTVKADPLGHTVDEVNDCLNADHTLLQTENLKAEVQLFGGNKLSMYTLFSKKERNARNASDLTPIESTVSQAAVPGTYGKSGWTTGPSPTYKLGDQYVINDRLLVDATYAHVGNNFILDYHDASLVDIQPTFVISTGLNGRSTPDGAQSVNIRPVNSFTVNANYFLPSTLGADHALKLGGYWRDNDGYSSTHTPGFAVARFPTATELANPNDCATQAAGCQMQLTRDGQTDFKLTNVSLYAQDAVTRGRTTLQLGLRYDYNHDRALGSSVVANPLRSDILPAVTFAGADPGVTFSDVSPRLGVTYDVTGNSTTVVHGNYAMYWGQVGTGGVASQIDPVTRVSIRYPWIDANHDTVVQAGEIVIPDGNIANYLALTGNWNPAAPGSPTTANTVDPHLKNDRTDEAIVGIDRQIGAGFAVGANYIWRRYANFQFTDTDGLESSDWTPVVYTPPAGSCPGPDGLRLDAASCPAVTYYVPNFQVGAVTTLTSLSADQYHRTYHGMELTARKRLSDRWLMNSSFAYNTTNTHIGSFAGSASQSSATSGTIPLSEDPTNRDQRNGHQYDYLTAGSGVGNVYVNAKWLFKLSGLYEAPYGFTLSAFYNARQGYPFERGVLSPSRANGGNTVFVLIDPVGESRLPNYQNLDVHFDRAFRFGQVRLMPQLDVFNVFDNSTIQAIRGTQNAATANQIQAITAPRVVRVGLKVNW